MHPDLIEVLNALGPVSDCHDAAQCQEVWQTLEAAMQASRTKLSRLTNHQQRFLYVLDVCDGLLLVSRSRSSPAQARLRTPAVENLEIHWLITEWIKFARQKLARQENARWCEVDGTNRSS